LIGPAIPAGAVINVTLGPEGTRGCARGRGRGENPGDLPFFAAKFVDPQPSALIVMHRAPASPTAVLRCNTAAPPRLPRRDSPRKGSVSRADPGRGDFASCDRGHVSSGKSRKPCISPASASC
jgi:hypothetical protein